MKEKKPPEKLDIRIDTNHYNFDRDVADGIFELEKKINEILDYLESEQ